MFSSMENSEKEKRKGVIFLRLAVLANEMFVSDLSCDDMRHSCLLIGCEEQSQGNCNSTALLLKRLL